MTGPWRVRLRGQWIRTAQARATAPETARASDLGLALAVLARERNSQALPPRVVVLERNPQESFPALEWPESARDSFEYPKGSSLAAPELKAPAAHRPLDYAQTCPQAPVRTCQHALVS